MSTLFEASFEAWSCQCSVEFIEPQCDTETMLSEIKDTLNTYEQYFSRFKNDSDLSQLNQGKTVQRTLIFDEILTVATKLQQDIAHTGFNLHVDLAAHGYDKSFETITDPQKNAASTELPTFPKGLILTPETMQLQKGVKIDFGSFLKGHLAEKFADKYASCCRGLIINLGGDLTVRGFDTHSPSFAIGIANPVTHFDESILLQNQSLSTSGTYKRRWTQDGKTEHHIINPEAQISCVSDFVSISFWGANGTLCDALSTAAFNVCPDTWDQWCEKFKNLNYLAISKNGAVKSSLHSKA